MASDREPPNTYSAVLNVIGSLAGSLALLMLVWRRGVDRHQLWHRSSDVAIIQSDTDDGTASGKRSTARPAMEAVGNFVLVFAFGIAIATHSWFAPLLIGAPLVAMVSSRNRVPDAYYNPSLTFAMLMRASDCIPRRPRVLAHPVGFRTVGGDAGVCDGRSRQLAVTAATVRAPLSWRR